MKRGYKKPTASIPLEELINFPKLFEDLRSLGMVDTTAGELLKEEKTWLIAPRKITGREKLFIFRVPVNEGELPNDMQVIVCTSWDIVTQKPRPRGKDAGWAFIRYKGKVKKFSKPARRTKNFAFNMYWRARTEIERVLGRPKDSEGRYMLMERGKAMFQRFWMSIERGRDGRYEKVELNVGLSPESMEYQKKRQKKIKKYYKKIKDEGKQIGAAALKRKKYKKVPINSMPCSIISNFPD